MGALAADELQAIRSRLSDGRILDGCLCTLCDACRLLDEVDRLRALLAEREAQTRQAVADLLREEQYSHDALVLSSKEGDTENVNYFRGEEDGHAAAAWRVTELLCSWTGEDPETVQIAPTPPDAKENRP